MHNCGAWRQSSCAPVSSKRYQGLSCPARHNSRRPRAPVLAQAAQYASEGNTQAESRRPFRLPQTPQLLALTQLHAENLWTSLQLQPHNQRQWLEHIYRLGHREHSDASAGGAISGLSIAHLQLGEPPSRTYKLPVFGGCPRGDKDPDFYANVGHAIRTLREEIPVLFQKDLSYDIYREDITFRDPRNHFTGIKNYKTIFWSLRFHGTLFFSHLHVDISRLWQPDEQTLRMRWKVVGTPRVPWEAQGTFDGVSNFRLDKRGKIYEHRVDNVILRDPPMQSPIFAGLNLLTGNDRTPVPNMFQGCDSTTPDCTDQYPTPVCIDVHHRPCHTQR